MTHCLFTWRERHVLQLPSSRIVIPSLSVGLLFLWLYLPLPISTALGTISFETLAIFAVLGRIPDAIATVREERSRTEAEKDAFEKFAQQVRGSNPAPEMTAGSASSPLGGETVAITTSAEDVPSTETSMDAVRDTYRETIMSVSHYKEEYNEPLEMNLTVEFGPEVAHVVTDGDILTPQLQKTLLQKSLQARNERRIFLQTLEDERESVIKVRRSLSAIYDTIDMIEESVYRHSVRELVESWKQIVDAEATCSEVLSERQSHVQAAPPGCEPLELQKYLYRSSAWTYPVLNDGIDCIDRLQETKSHVIKTLSQR